MHQRGGGLCSSALEVVSPRRLRRRCRLASLGGGEAMQEPEGMGGNPVITRVVDGVWLWVPH